MMMPKARVDDCFYAQCRSCKRAIFSMDGKLWHIDGGFNAETLGEVAASFIAIIDDFNAMIVARIPVPLGASEEEVDGLKILLREQYGLDEPGSNLSMRDNRRTYLHQLHQRARVHGRAPMAPATAATSMPPMPPLPAAALPDRPQASA
jgi:hypothetical protein